MSTASEVFDRDEMQRSLSQPVSIHQLKEKYKEGMEAIPTGFGNLDRTGGIYRGMCCVLVAETGMGKSLFALNLALRLNEKGFRSLYLDLENGGHQMIDRLDKMKISEAQHLTLLPAEATENLVASQSGVLLAKAVITYLDKLEKPDLLIIDPLEVFEDQGHENYTTLAQATDMFKKFANKHNLAVLILHHLNKGAKNDKQVEDPHNLEEMKRTYRIPSLESVRGSSKISSRATEVWGMVRQMHSEIKYEQSKTLLRVLKSRGGRSHGDYKFFLDTDSLKLEEHQDKELKRMQDALI